MRVVLIGGVLPPDSVVESGVSSVVNTLVEAFSDFKKHKFFLLGANINKRIEKGNRIYERLPLPIPKLGISLNFLLFGSKIVKKIDKFYHPDIYHFQAIFPNLILINKTIQRRSVFTQHAILEEEYKLQTTMARKLKYFIKIIYVKFFIRRLRNFIYISKYNQNYIKYNYPSLKIKNSVLINNPVNPIYFNSHHENTEKRIYFVGEIKKRKGLHLLLKTISKLNKDGIVYTLDIIGGFKEGMYKKYINKIINNSGFLKEQIKFHGWRRVDEVIEITKKCSIFVLPSYQETLPVSVAEAMAMKKLVIATSLPGIKEMIVNNKDGLLLRKGDIGQLEIYLKKIWNNDININKISHNAYKKAMRNFSSTVVANDTIKFYKKILKKRNIS